MARLVDAGSDPQFHPQRESYWVKVNPRRPPGLLPRGQALPLQLTELAPKRRAVAERSGELVADHDHIHVAPDVEVPARHRARNRRPDH